MNKYKDFELFDKVLVNMIMMMIIFVVGGQLITSCTNYIDKNAKSESVKSAKTKASEVSEKWRKQGRKRVDK